jgi:ribosomal protein S21
MINAEVKIFKKGDPKLSLDRALQRLKNKLTTEGTLETVRAKRAFENPKQKAERKLKQRLRLIKKKVLTK